MVQKSSKGKLYVSGHTIFLLHLMQCSQLQEVCVLYASYGICYPVKCRKAVVAVSLSVKCAAGKAVSKTSSSVGTFAGTCGKALDGEAAATGI